MDSVENAVNDESVPVYTCMLKNRHTEQDQNCEIAAY